MSNGLRSFLSRLSPVPYGSVVIASRSSFSPTVPVGDGSPRSGRYATEGRTKREMKERSDRTAGPLFLSLPFPSPLHSPRRARSVGDGDGKGNRMSTEPDPTTDGTGREGYGRSLGSSAPLIIPSLPRASRESSFFLLTHGPRSGKRRVERGAGERVARRDGKNDRP